MIYTIVISITYKYNVEILDDVETLDDIETLYDCEIYTMAETYNRDVLYNIHLTLISYTLQRNILSRVPCCIPI